MDEFGGSEPEAALAAVVSLLQHRAMNGQFCERFDIHWALRRMLRRGTMERR